MLQCCAWCFRPTSAGVEVHYGRFSDDVDTVFGPKYLEATPLAPVSQTPGKVPRECWAAS